MILISVEHEGIQCFGINLKQLNWPPWCWCTCNWNAGTLKCWYDEGYHLIRRVAVALFALCSMTPIKLSHVAPPATVAAEIPRTSNDTLEAPQMVGRLEHAVMAPLTMMFKLNSSLKISHTEVQPQTSCRQLAETVAKASTVNQSAVKVSQVLQANCESL